ncbi:MAG: MATE family efflux transporter [Rhodospirillales bacterium]|jgi:MATE family multidrug resistance protein|nr:MATE family efflux transporter [Rhodospirillales bacterium]MDP6882581.1 MATE family efflux transporter [Rhodospirillales bacterium]
MADEFIQRRVWRLAGPIILANVSVPLLGLVDTAVVGHLPGPHYVGAVAVGALVFNVLYFGLGFLRMGTTGLAAQALGSGNADEVRATLARAVLVAVALGTFMVVVRQPVTWAALAIIAPSGNVVPLADTYISIRIWGAPAALANAALMGWFIGVHNTRAVLAQQLVMNGLNIVLDLVFVIGFGFGVAGVAAASLIAQVAAPVFGLWLVRRDLARIGGRWRRDLIFEGTRFRRMLAVNRDIFLRSIILISTNVVFISVGAQMGDVVLAANAILFQFHHLAAWTLDGFAYAAEALTGSAVGAGDRPRFREAVRVTGIWALALASGFTLAYLVFGALLIDVITDVEEVRVTARLYLPWAVIIPIVSVWGFMLDGIFVGATRVAEMRNAMVITAILYFGAVALLVPAMANHGLWLAVTLLSILRAVTMGVQYPRIERAVGETA